MSKIDDLENEFIALVNFVSGVFITHNKRFLREQWAMRWKKIRELIQEIKENGQ